MPRLEVHTVFVLHQRRYERVYKFEQIGPETWNWLGCSLEALEEHSKQKPVAIAEAIALDRGLQLVQDLDVWKSRPSNDSANFGVSDIVALFQALEQRLEESEHGEYIKIGISRAFRTFIARHLWAKGQQFIAKRLSKCFRSSLKRSYTSGRELISDLPKPGRKPVGAIAFDTHAELKANTLKTLRDDLTEILRCCEDILRRYEHALSYLSDLVRMEISSEDATRIKEKSKNIQRRAPQETWHKDDLSAYLSLVKKEEVEASANVNKHDVKKRFHPLGAKQVLLEGVQGLKNGAHIKDLMQLDVAPPSEVLLACALILQIHTHWNFISILELTSSDLAVSTFPHRLQSLKPRSSDETPIVFVERSDELVLRAMKHLCERRERMVNAGIIDGSNKNIWFSAWFLKGVPPQPVVSWGAELREFTSCYKLPAFTLEQVRVQCLALVATTHRGLGGAIQSAGHVAGNTTLRYIDKALLVRLNSSNLLEFERRLENTVRYEMGRSPVGRRLAALSLGNGTQCADPHNPPSAAWMNAGICEAEMCHQGNGCPHRQIALNRARLEEVVRSKNYYVSNWKRLADENTVRFEKVHVPHMLFSLALYGIVKKGPYRHLVARLEK